MSYSFTKYENRTIVYTLSPKLKVALLQLTHGFSLLQFTDDAGNKIPIPNEVICYEYGNGALPYNIALHKINNEFFHLFYENNYKIEYNGCVIIDMSSTS